MHMYIVSRSHETWKTVRVAVDGVNNAYLNCSSVSNFLGFLGQHEHIQWLPMRDSATGGSPCAAILLADSGALLRGNIATPEVLFADVGDANICRLGSRDSGASKDEVLVMLEVLDSMFDEAYEKARLLDAVEERDSGFCCWFAAAVCRSDLL